MVTQISWCKANRLSDEELRTLSMEKDKIGNASHAALMAQYILLERAGHTGIRKKSEHGWAHPTFIPLSDARWDD